ncbi:glutamate-cysteine ligase family protein [Asanoa sp. WMMD1127]|uniref:carboxylate-amine ligase n=1 Tax=Asanoa sp. WMMD1127 TaxID=3016107 RepID=UPI002417D4EB|nr:glutamate-cysteine ligase family protein [Asanoa sp. WMMD1127]MDG4820857.1 glutamate-cysteine ligase family protein [Asanoa sp. WMMD1127]
MTMRPGPAGHDVATLDQPAFAVSVEEEFLLLDPDDGGGVPLGHRVVTTRPYGDLAELGERLDKMRWAAAVAAHGAGARLTAIGATPVSDIEPGMYRDTAVAGCRVRVSVPDRAVATDVCERLRVWLPVIHAITANSPLHLGADSGQASWRSIRGLLDRRTTFWHASPWPADPAVDVDAGDVCLTTAETVLAAGLVRGLVATAVADIRAGRPAPRLRDGVLSVAYRRAAHSGLDGELVDPFAGQLRPAWELVDELAALVRPALAGDAELVDGGLAQLRRHGNGATRQRAVLRRTGSVPQVLDAVADQTLRPWR